MFVGIFWILHKSPVLAGLCHPRGGCLASRSWGGGPGPALGVPDFMGRGRVPHYSWMEWKSGLSSQPPLMGTVTQCVCPVPFTWVGQALSKLPSWLGFLYPVLCLEREQAFPETFSFCVLQHFSVWGLSSDHFGVCGRETNTHSGDCTAMSLFSLRTPTVSLLSTFPRFLMFGACFLSRDFSCAWQEV